MTFIDELRPLMFDKVGVQGGTRDDTGGFVPSGAIQNLDCHIEGGPVRVTDAGGREVVSRYQIYIGDPQVLDERNFQYTLPVRFPEPNSDIRAIRVDVETDEIGPSHTVVYLP